MSRLVPLAVVALTLAACDQQLTEGYDLVGTWAQVDVPAGEPGQQWTFHDDLTYDKLGGETESGIFFVEGTRLTIQDDASSIGPDHLAFDYVSTDSHWLEHAAYATGPVAGRVGTWHGVFENLGEPLTVDYTITLRADRTVHETRRITGPGRDELYEGDGTWADSPTGSSFTISIMLVGPAGTITETYSAWRLGDAIGGPLYERVAF
ncbi:MAG: hypothetical protein F9K40_16655 [Kofleriaceae bacterium]|nr:MAG: hypothetical protein F9K40_16655 [Kofleriaceae bacterium]